jgi:hypothetical protein
MYQQSPKWLPQIPPGAEWSRHSLVQAKSEPGLSPLHMRPLYAIFYFLILTFDLLPLAELRTLGFGLWWLLRSNFRNEARNQPELLKCFFYVKLKPLRSCRRLCTYSFLFFTFAFWLALWRWIADVWLRPMGGNAIEFPQWGARPVWDFDVFFVFL